MNMENKEFTFWKLIFKYIIEIPAIQRDYVQDRLYSNLKKEECAIQRDYVQDRLYSNLKKEECDIVGDIANSLRKSTKINLHFIYGKVENQQLIPLDGQQRLTTLFLIHWFLSLGKLTDDDKQILSKFTYETRPSSEDFCLKLVKESIVFQNDIKVSQQIINSKWFFLSWKNDPTIQAMLNMLDIIQTKFKQPNEDLFNLLCNKNCPVIFNFLPLTQFKLDDEIYVKMNSRGKPLTDFENFKAHFSVLFDNDNKSKLDNEWLDIFWNFEKNNQTIDIDEVDRKYLSFIKNISLCFYAEYKDISKKEKDDFSIFKSYKDIYRSNSNFLNQIIITFDALTTYEDTEKHFNNFLKDNPDYWEYLRFYAVTQFFIHCGDLNNTKIETYNKWIRVCENLINNTLIQSPDEFYKAIRSIKELANNIQNIYEYLSLPETKITGFLQNQCEEEKIKAKLILDDKSNQWHKAIEKIEYHSYFNGQIGLILNFAKTDTNFNIDKFLDYSDKIDILFSSKFQDHYNCLFQRALLTFGDYLVPISGHYTFCKFDNNLRAKMDNWRKVFNDDIKRNYLKQLLDAIKIDSIKNDLQTIINNFQENENDWMSLFIKNNGIIEYCNNYQINKGDDQIDLARSSAKRWRKKAELRSYVFYKTKLEGKESTFNPFEKVRYYDSSDGSPYAVIDTWKYQSKYSFEIDIRYSDDKFSLIFYDRNRKILPDEIIQKLNQKDFISNIEKNDEDVEVIKSCTSKIEGNIDFMKVEQTIKEILKM